MPALVLQGLGSEEQMLAFLAKLSSDGVPSVSSRAAWLMQQIDTWRGRVLRNSVLLATGTCGVLPLWWR